LTYSICHCAICVLTKKEKLSSTGEHGGLTEDRCMTPMPSSEVKGPLLATLKCGLTVGVWLHFCCLKFVFLSMVEPLSSFLPLHFDCSVYFPHLGSSGKLVEFLFLEQFSSLSLSNFYSKTRKIFRGEPRESTVQSSLCCLWGWWSAAHEGGHTFIAAVCLSEGWREVESGSRNHVSYQGPFQIILDRGKLLPKSVKVKHRCRHASGRFLLCFYCCLVEFMLNVD
jgi:hypothetical protein